MARLAPVRQDVIDSLADEILRDHGHGRVIVAIDAEDAAAADAFGADLVELLKKRGHSAFAARMNDFVSPRDRREAWGPDSAEVRYRNTYDLSVLRRVLIDPFRMGGSTGFVAAAYDRAREQQIQAKWLTAPEDSILVVSGEFLHRPELRTLWTYTVWLDSSRSKKAPAGRVDPLAAGARKLYAKDVKVRESANAVVDNTDPENPVRVVG
jgi:uridine kinase